MGRGSLWPLEPFAIVPPGQTAAALAESLSCAAPYPQTRSLKSLHELGIDRVGRLFLECWRDVWPLALIALGAGRGQKMGRRFVERLKPTLFGLGWSLIVPYRPPPEIVVETRLEYPVSQRAALQSLLEHLLEQVVGQLAERQQGAIRLECQLQCDDGRRLDVPVGLYQASAERAHLLELLLMRVERLALPAPLVAMRLAVLLAAPLEWRQRELFDQTSAREGRRQLALLIDRLSNRMGREAVVRAQLQPDAQPELSVRYEPLTATPLSSRPTAGGGTSRLLCHWQAKSASGYQAAGAHGPRCPCHPAPVGIGNAALSGASAVACAAGAAVAILVARRWRRVPACWGPERIQTGWWRGPYVQRVITTAGNGWRARLLALPPADRCRVVFAWCV